MASGLALQFQVLIKARSLEKSCRWTRAALEHHQRRRLSALLEFAREKSPFYREFHAGTDNRDLKSLPILTKSILMENFDGLVTNRSIKLHDVEAFLRHDNGAGLFQGRYVALSTSGSTGQRGVFLFSPGEWVESLASISRPMQWAGVRARVFRRLRNTMVASTTPWHYSSRVGRSLSTPLLPTLRLDASEPLDAMVRRLNEWQPQVMVAYPSILRQLADEQIAGRLDISPWRCATSAEVLSDETRRLVRTAWGIDIFETYGATEYAPIAAQCEAGRRHLFEDGAVIEIVDEKGNPVPEGVTGDRVLLTVFNRRTQPLIRYEISDMVRVASGKCECGRPFRTIETIEGRKEDVLTFPAVRAALGTIAVHPNAFHRVLESVPASGWQVVQDGQTLSVNLTGLKDASVCPSIQAAILDLLKSEGAVAGRVVVRPVPELRRGKTGKAPLILANTRSAAATAAASASASASE